MTNEIVLATLDIDLHKVYAIDAELLQEIRGSNDPARD